VNKVELIQSLVDMINGLPHRDKEKLDALKRRAEMIIRTMFGESSKYIKDLNNIYFFPRIGPVDEDYCNECWLSGKNKMLNLFNTIFEELELCSSNQKVDERQKADVTFLNRIFIVHGHDEAMKQGVARTLEKIGLEPIILHEKSNEGRTIIEKFTDYSDVSFAIVILSPDDLAYPKDQSAKGAKLRARQNVIFELGFFIGKLGRNRVLVLYQKENNFEMPSDYSGVLYIPYDKSGQWRLELIKELKACGYDVDANKLICS
jgi:predicted nucleotide-binding protein